MNTVTVGVLALQGAFKEHLSLLRQTTKDLSAQQPDDLRWEFIEVRNADELSRCDALIIPGGESTAISLVAARSNMLEPLREFVRVQQRPVWGTCAGLILLAESANRTKKGGQELIGGLDVRVNRNHFGRQVESFQADLELPFLSHPASNKTNRSAAPFKGVFIRAPIVEAILPERGEQAGDRGERPDVVRAPLAMSKELAAGAEGNKVQVMATLPGRASVLPDEYAAENVEKEAGDIIAVKQGAVFGTSFHPELTGDPRIHAWWLNEVRNAVEAARHRHCENI